MTPDTPPEHELPDDVNRWPDDPAKLLGVAQDVSRLDLKRAYTRLIRRYKPEHAPEQFRRLREAFEQLDQQLEWRAVYEEHLAKQREQCGDASDNDEDETKAGPSGGSGQNGAAATADAESQDIVLRRVGERAEDEDSNNGLWRSRASSNAGDQLWQQTLDGGELRPVYLRLVEQAAQQLPSEIGYARLYWLLTIHPEFDSARDPCAWLIEGFRKHGLSGRLLSMFSIEVRRRMGQVPLALADDLLDGNDAANHLVDLAQTRWFAARCLGRFDVIGDDVERLRTRLLDEPFEWQRLLCGAARLLVMVRSERAGVLLAAIRAEFALTSTDVSSEWQWESLENTVALHEAWANDPQRLITRAMHPANNRTQLLLARLATLVEVTWECSPLQARSDLIAMCVELTADPAAGLSELTWIASVSRPLVRRLLELLYEQRAEFGGDENYQITPAVEAELHRFVRSELWHKGYSSEATVLSFCLREAVTPQDVATAIEQQLEELPDHFAKLADSLRYHLPLICLVEAQRALW